MLFCIIDAPRLTVHGWSRTRSLPLRAPEPSPRVGCPVVWQPGQEQGEPGRKEGTGKEPQPIVMPNITAMAGAPV